MRYFAPAKVNLALHVTGRREDGYHLLDSLVVFAGIGDWLDIDAGQGLALSVSGPRADGVPTDRSNLVWRAAEAFDRGRGATIHLEKHLPHAGGIGGGSADAGAALRGLSELWGVPMPDLQACLSLGADLPVCAACEPARMRGIGEVLDRVPAIPPLWIVLVNPGVAVPTGDVFRALDGVNNAPMPDPDWSGPDDFVSWLSRTRNDLEPAAIAIAPEVLDVLQALRDEAGCLLARMSGSGATCFGLFAGKADAEAAARGLRAGHGHWWVEAAEILSEAPRPQPRQVRRATT